jgi:DNA-directed RNA polymerase subunit RPC12/RpoP
MRNKVQNDRIICKHCGKDTGKTYGQFMHIVLYHDIRCPHCNGIVIRVLAPLWIYNGVTPIQEFN